MAPPPPKNQQKKKGTIAGLPWWAWVAAIIIGLGVGFLLTRSGKGRAATGGGETTPQPQTGQGGGGAALLFPSGTESPMHQSLRALGVYDPSGYYYDGGEGGDPNAPISEQIDFGNGITANVDRVDPAVYSTPAPQTNSTPTPAFPIPPMSTSTPSPSSGSSGYVPTTVRPLDPSRAGGVQYG